jgi:DNA-binding beta-propeller fold protein YncE
MKRNRHLFVGGTFVALILALAIAQMVLGRVAVAQSSARVQAPMFQVDPMWPKYLPNHWVLGSTIGVTVDSHDHIWVIHRPASLANNEKGAALDPPIAACCIPAPPILEFDQAGNLVSAWGGPGAGYEWPDSEHGIFVDFKDNVWTAGNGKGDAQILKFTRQGKFLLQIGHKGKNGGSNDTQNLGQPADIEVDPTNNEAYIADGYGNKRVIVYDGDTGAYKRHWGAYGNKPDDTDPGRYDPSAPPAKQFRNPVHCAVIANDGLVYVCDRLNDRIQVFKKDGTFVKEGFIATKTLGSGSVFDVGFSRDPQQRFVYTPDGQNHKVWILLRDPLQVLNSFGDGGRQPGLFYGTHNLAVDSKGNIYTVETYEGKRVQKFVYQGLGTVTSQN